MCRAPLGDRFLSLTATKASISRVWVASSRDWSSLVPGVVSTNLTGCYFLHLDMCFVLFTALSSMDRLPCILLSNDNVLNLVICRLKEDQLSAVSQQIQVIQAALKNKEASCNLLGTDRTESCHGFVLCLYTCVYVCVVCMFVL